MSSAPRAKNRPATPARILVVEDQDSIREFTRAVLAGAGYNVAVAINGVDAVATVRDTGFDLILMDVCMPIVDGLTAARTIRALKGPQSKVPIIALSDDVQSIMNAGMNDYICKPFRPAELLLKVDTWLKGECISPSAGPSGKPEGTAFEEVCELMGRPWALRALTKLKVQIDETFGAESGVARNDGQLGGQAHALVSFAAILGFYTLSDLCSTLEEACRSGHDVQPPFESAKAAALKARRSAAGLIAGLRTQEP